MNTFLPYDPGVLPSRPAPVAGERIELHVIGLPPIKDLHQSIRNPKHPFHDRFIALRKASTEVMGGRAWVFAPVELELIVRCPEADRHSLTDFLSGILDTLDGSSGFTFTFLPVIFEDDSQVIASHIKWEQATQCSYSVAITIR